MGGGATAQAAEGTPTNDNEESSNISNDSSNIKDVKEVTLPTSQESADKTNVAPSTTNSPQEAEQPAPTTINEKKSDKAVVQSSNVANKEDESANKDQDYEDKQSSILKIQNNQQINSNILKKNLTESKVEDSLKDFHFTGAISSFKNTTAGKDENYLTFKDGDTAEIAYQIQGFGGTGSKSGFFYDTPNSYLLLIPKGFVADGKVTASYAYGNYTISSQEVLHGIGKNGEDYIKINCPNTPYYGAPVAAKINLTAKLKEDDGGYVSYNNSLPSPFMAINNGSFSSSNDVQLGNTTYHIANNEWDQNLNYTLIPGKQALDSNNFNISSSTVELHPGDTTNSGYEQLNATINLTHHVENGDYLDFHLGLPLQDGKILPYDTQLSDGFDAKYQGTTIGHVFKMDGYYRLVFNTAVNQFFGNSGSSFTDTFHLKWNSGTANPAIRKPTSVTDHNFGKPFVYQYTSDKNQNQELFGYTPTNDVNIGGKVSASGLTIGGQYIYHGKILQCNQSNGSSVVFSINRIWDKNNHVQIYTNWYNNEAVSIAIKAKDPSKSASNNFAITVIVGQNPYLTYNWTSDTDLANQIKKTIAYYHTHELSNPIQNDNNILTQDKDTKGAQLPDGSVTVTHEEKIENGVVTRTYHVKISNPEVELDGAISPLGVSASGFTMPDNIRSYSEDVANAEANKKGNFGGTDDLSANTSNETLKKALEDTDTIKVAISNESETTSKNVSGVLGSPWFAKIGYSGSNLGPNGDDPSNYITTKLIFKDDSGNVVGPSDGFKFQGKSGTTISFNGVEQELVDLINQGYNIDHVASKSGNTETTISPSGDKNKISSYNFGNISTASATPDEFIVYLKASHAPITDTSKKVTETVHYIFQDENGQVLNTPTRDDHHAELDFTGTKPYGSKDSDPFTYDDGKTFNAVTIDPQLGFKLISAKTADGTDVLDGNSVKALEGINHNTPNVVVNVIFKAQPQADLTDTKNVTETIKYVFQDANGHVITSTSRKADSQTLTFTGTRADKNDQFAYDEPKSFDAVAIAAQAGFDLISATNDASHADVLGDNAVKQIAGIKHDSAPVNITVVFKAQPQADLTDTKNVTETIKYVFQDANGHVITSTSRKADSQTLTFTGTRADKNDQFAYDEPKSFDAVAIAAQAGFDLISATNDASHADVLGDNAVKQIAGIKHDSAPVNITVVFKAQPQNNPGGNPQPSTPDKPVTPVQPSTPNTPETPVVPTTPDVPGTTPETPTTNPEVPGTPSVPNTSEAPHKQEVTVDTTKVSETPVQNIGESTETKQQGQKLPQTSNQNGSHLALAGLAVTAIASLFGITGERKRKGKN